MSSSSSSRNARAIGDRLCGRVRVAPRSARAAGRSARVVQDFRSSVALRSVIRRATPGKTSPAALIDLVDSLTGVIERTAELLVAGKHVRVVEDNEAMTTQNAADLLNVSRPHLVKLLKTGQIPQLPNVGSHRRVARVAVLKYKRTREARREPALKKLAALSQRHRLGY